jgi:hydroxypyruvate isomerase
MSRMDRREFIAAGLGLAASSAVQAGPQGAPTPASAPKLRQSVCRWCLSRLELPQVCDLARRCGIESVELLDPEDIQRVRDRGLSCAIANGPCSISKGLNRLEHHEEIVRKAETLFPRIAAAGCERVIVFAGDRQGLDDATGLWNCAVGLRRLLPLAESSNLIMAIELLNSKVDHRDHMGDRFAWGIELCETVSSVRFGLLYDIYHMQIMDGDVIRSLTSHRPWIRHIHTAGVPGRGPLGRDQELNYGAIIRALHDAGYRGYVGHEFMARGDVETELKAAVTECLG